VRFFGDYRTGDRWLGISEGTSEVGLVAPAARGDETAFLLVYERARLTF
jgi:hypothetical protein